MTDDRRTIRFRPSATIAYDRLSPKHKKVVNSTLDDIQDRGVQAVPAKNIQGTSLNGHVYKMWVNQDVLMVFTVEPDEVNVFDLIKKGRYENIKKQFPKSRI